MWQISLQDVPLNLGGQILMFEVPKPFLLEDSNDKDGQIDGEENVFISSIQAWIDGACEKDKFPWLGLMVRDRTPPHEEDGIGKGMVIMMFEDILEHVDEKLEWLHWLGDSK